MAAAIADEDNHDDDHKDLVVTGVNLGKHTEFDKHEFQMIVITNIRFLPFLKTLSKLTSFWHFIDLDLDLTFILVHGNALDWPLGDLTFPLVGVSAHNVGHVLALPPLDGIIRCPGPLPLIDTAPLARDGRDGLRQRRHEVIRRLSRHLMAESHLGQVSLTSQQISYECEKWT